jgi:hypothetical protein
MALIHPIEDTITNISNNFLPFSPNKICSASEAIRLMLAIFVGGIKYIYKKFIAKYSEVTMKIPVIKAKGRIFLVSLVSSATNVFSCHPPYVQSIGINAKPNDEKNPLLLNPGGREWK